MNYTKNYRLPQWVKSDRIMMDDFNAAMASMESGMTRAEGKADAAAAAANAAKQTADTAKQGADNAYSPGNKPYRAGSYTGTGADMEFNLGFRPSCVIISGIGTHGGGNAAYVANYFGMTCGETLTSRIRLTDTGFVAIAGSTAPALAFGGITYDYIAFQ